jgi:AraC-like DNA-binding protein
VQNLDLEVIQTGKGLFSAYLANFSTGLCDVQTGSISQKILAKGATRKDRVGFLIELRKGSEWRCFGRDMGDTSVAVWSGGHELLIAANPGTDWMFVSVAPEVLDKCADAIYGRALPLRSRGLFLIKPEPVQIAAIHGLLGEYLETTDTALGSRTRSLIDRALVRSMVQITIGKNSEIDRPSLSLKRLLKNVEDFFAAHLNKPIDPEQLGKALGLAREHIEEIQEGVGVDPVEYLRVLRLAHVYKALLMADPQHLSAADIAQAWGFSNMGRFTREFADFFKKSPSQVLLQPGEEYRNSVLSRVVD